MEGWKKKETANKVIGEDKDTHICFSVSKRTRKEQMWYIDSGATSHMTNNKEFFKTLDTCTNENILLANENSAKVFGIGDSYLICKNNKVNKARS